MAGVVLSQAPGLVLDLDPDLGEGIAEEEWETARQACHGEQISVPGGRWDLPSMNGGGNLVGLLIVKGLLCREVTMRDRCLFELLGPGDVLQPPATAPPGPSLATDIRLTAVVETTLVALGQSFMHAVARWPGILVRVLERLEAQRERLAVQGLIAHFPRAEHRVLLALWHLADRWGRVIPEGTVIPLPLTHDLLGQLTGTRRSTVTLALTELESKERVLRLADGSWLLTSVAARAVEAIAGPAAGARTVGETLILRHRVYDTRRESEALRAEARQIRRRRVAPPRRALP